MHADLQATEQEMGDGMVLSSLSFSWEGAWMASWAINCSCYNISSSYLVIITSWVLRKLKYYIFCAQARHTRSEEVSANGIAMATEIQGESVPHLHCSASELALALEYRPVGQFLQDDSAWICSVCADEKQLHSHKMPISLIISKHAWASALSNFAVISDLWASDHFDTTSWLIQEHLAIYDFIK